MPVIRPDGDAERECERDGVPVVPVMGKTLARFGFKLLVRSERDRQRDGFNHGSCSGEARGSICLRDLTSSH